MLPPALRAALLPLQASLTMFPPQLPGVEDSGFSQPMGFKAVQVPATVHVLGR